MSDCNCTKLVKSGITSTVFAWPSRIGEKTLLIPWMEHYSHYVPDGMSSIAASLYGTICPIIVRNARKWWTRY
jgi:hypothetical protein